MVNTRSSTGAGASGAPGAAAQHPDGQLPPTTTMPPPNNPPDELQPTPYSPSDPMQDTSAFLDPDDTGGQSESSDSSPEPPERLPIESETRKFFQQVARGAGWHDPIVIEDGQLLIRGRSRNEPNVYLNTAQMTNGLRSRLLKLVKQEHDIKKLQERLRATEQQLEAAQAAGEGGGLARHQELENKVRELKTTLAVQERAKDDMNTTWEMTFKDMTSDIDKSLADVAAKNEEVEAVKKKNAELERKLKQTEMDRDACMAQETATRQREEKGMADCRIGDMRIRTLQKESQKKDRRLEELERELVLAERAKRNAIAAREDVAMLPGPSAATARIKILQEELEEAKSRCQQLAASNDLLTTEKDRYSYLNTEAVKELIDTTQQYSSSSSDSSSADERMPKHFLKKIENLISRLVESPEEERRAVLRNEGQWMKVERGRGSFGQGSSRADAKKGQQKTYRDIAAQQSPGYVQPGGAGLREWPHPQATPSAADQVPLQHLGRRSRFAPLGVPHVSPPPVWRPQDHQRRDVPLAPAPADGSWQEYHDRQAAAAGNVGSDNLFFRSAGRTGVGAPGVQEDSQRPPAQSASGAQLQPIAATAVDITPPPGAVNTTTEVPDPYRLKSMSIGMKAACGNLTISTYGDGNFIPCRNAFMRTATQYQMKESEMRIFLPQCFTDMAAVHYEDVRQNDEEAPAVEVWKILEDRLANKSQVAHARMLFFNDDMRPGESVAEFVTRKRRKNSKLPEKNSEEVLKQVLMTKLPWYLREPALLAPSEPLDQMVSTLDQIAEAHRKKMAARNYQQPRRSYKTKEALYKVDEDAMDFELEEENARVEEAVKEWPVVDKQGTGEKGSPIGPTDAVLPSGFSQFKQCHNCLLWGHLRSYRGVKCERQRAAKPKNY